VRTFILGLVTAILCANASIARADNETFAKLYREVKPSVVYVVAAMRDGAQSGTGFIYSSNSRVSRVVTANHVVEGATQVDVILDSDLAKRYPARVVRRDHVRDVALLEIDAPNRIPLKLADPSSIQEGMDVALIGYPRVSAVFERVDGDDLRPTVHRGIVSAIRLNGSIVQYDAISDHGDSGGPVIDASNGHVLAIVHGVAAFDPYFQGLPQPLPGSEYGMSASTIQGVVSGLATTSGASASSSSASSSGTIPTSQSAAYRVGFGLPQYADPTTEAISQAVLTRLVAHFKEDNSIYAIPTEFGITAEDAQIINGNCQDERLNALMEPLVRWEFKGKYIPGLYDGRVTEVWVDLLVTDCSGAPFYFGEKTKWERPEFANREPTTEVIDMSNDMLDQVIKDFENYTTLHKAAWDSLLKVGIGIDPDDDRYHALYYPYPDKAGVWRVWTVTPGGPADLAGVKADDVIESINGTNLEGMKVDDAATLFDNASYTLVVRRPGGDVTLTVLPKKYADLLKMVNH
jgi:S1-C subfamily serine protease